MKTNLELFKKKNLSDEVFDIILDSIISGEISTGSNLSINQLSKELEISSTPVREALNKLANQRLVKKIPHKGYMLRKFTEKDITDIYEYRSAIESYACKLAVERIKENEEKELIKLLDKMVEMLNNNNKVEYVKLHKEFHNKIIKASKNSEIENSYKKITNLVDIIISSITGFTMIRAEKSIEEHKNIIEGISKGDSHKAFREMNNNIMNAAEFIKNNMTEIGVDKINRKHH